MPNPRVAADERRRRGTFRADRDYDNTPAPETLGGVVLAQYKNLGEDALTKARRGEDVSAEVAYLRQAEDALRENGFLRVDCNYYADFVAIQAMG